MFIFLKQYIVWKGLRTPALALLKKIPTVQKWMDEKGATPVLEDNETLMFPEKDCK